MRVGHAHLCAGPLRRRFFLCTPYGSMVSMLTGMILAAGMGKRLKDLGIETPKPLLPVAGKTLLEHMMAFVRGLGSDELIVVGGYQFPKVEAVARGFDAKAKLAENPDFLLQNLLSFKRGVEIAPKGDLFVCNADYIFKEHTKEAVKANLTKLAVFSSTDLSGDTSDVMKVKVDESGNVTEMSKQLTDFSMIYTGMFFIPESLRDLVLRLTDDILATADQTKATVEWLFPALRKAGEKVYSADIGKADWFEIDTPEEWALAKLALER